MPQRIHDASITIILIPWHDIIFVFDYCVQIYTKNIAAKTRQIHGRDTKEWEPFTQLAWLKYGEGVYGGRWSIQRRAKNCRGAYHALFSLNIKHQRIEEMMVIKQRLGLTRHST